jgi:hypothetical protein
MPISTVAIRVAHPGRHFACVGRIERRSGDTTEVIGETRLFPYGCDIQVYREAARLARAKGLACGFRTGNVVHVQYALRAGIVTRVNREKNTVQVMIAGDSGPAWYQAQSVRWLSEAAP